MVVVHHEVLEGMQKGTHQVGVRQVPHDSHGGGPTMSHDWVHHIFLQPHKTWTIPIRNRQVSPLSLMRASRLQTGRSITKVLHTWMSRDVVLAMTQPSQVAMTTCPGNPVLLTKRVGESGGETTMRIEEEVSNSQKKSWTRRRYLWNS